MTKLSLMLLGVCAVVRAPASDDRSADNVPVSLPEFVVASERVGRLEVAVRPGDLQAAAPNLVQQLLTIPGVAGSARAADSAEPNIRGLGFDRVTTTLNGIPLANASPERTNAPVATLGGAAVTDVHVIKALPSVTFGPATTGGRIALSTGESWAPSVGEFHRGAVNVTYDGARDGISTRAQFNSHEGAWEGSLTFFHNDLGDYRAPDGREVAARLDEHGASAGFGWSNADHRVRADFLQRRLRRQETVSLPLDGKNSDAEVFTLGDCWSIRRGALEKIEWRAGGAFADPFITSEDRKAPLIYAQATTRSAAAGVDSFWRLGEGELATGADFGSENRNAVRTTAAGLDHIWPDAVYADAGAFAEWNRPLNPAWSLRLGARADRVASDARAAGENALGRPILDWFALYNGPEAANVKRSDWVGAANLLLNWTAPDRRGLAGFFGGGLSVQPAPVTERYRAFLNALGGDGHGGNAVELGNPALRSERKWEVQTGGSWRQGWAELEATAYYYRIEDFILRTRIGTTQPPLSSMVVFGYRNVNAEFFGGEVGATFKPAPRLTVPMTFAMSEGRNSTTGVGLSEVPPWEATIAACYRSPAPFQSLRAEFGARLVGARSNASPFENPIFSRAAGFSLWHLRGGWPIARHLELDWGVENIFDRSYTEYLTPPVAPFKPASGNLAPGDQVPGPARSAWLSITRTF